MAASRALIPRKLYRKISANVPIVCVDLLIWRDHKLLLVRRKNHPLRGHWWLVGGRVLLGEDPKDAARRKAKEEAGLELVSCKFVAYYSDVFPRNAFERTPTQTVSLVFICEASGDVVLDKQSSAYKWADGMPPRFARKICHS